MTSDPVLIVGAFLLYFLPAILARTRRHRNYDAILLLNLFLGWTALGWVIALIWSATANTAPKGERANANDARAREPEREPLPPLNPWVEAAKLGVAFLVFVAFLAGLIAIL